MAVSHRAYDIYCLVYALVVDLALNLVFNFGFEGGQMAIEAFSSRGGRQGIRGGRFLITLPSMSPTSVVNSFVFHLVAASIWNQSMDKFIVKFLYEVCFEYVVKFLYEFYFK